MEYRMWRKKTAEVLRDRHQLGMSVMLEREWRRFYVKGLAPKDAADQAQVYWHHYLTPAERLLRQAG